MIKKEQKGQSLQNLYGGSGTVHIVRKLTTHDAVSGLDMFAEVTLDVGASIGYHLHDTDAEAYYIVHGEGIFLDDGRVEKTVQSGDLCLITKGQGHGLTNTGKTPLHMIAVVWS
jgi:mannose-6-phosphate isomerase-like protein (cupin superfamily)